VAKNSKKRLNRVTVEQKNEPAKKRESEGRNRDVEGKRAQKKRRSRLGRKDFKSTIQTSEPKKGKKGSGKKQSSVC